MEDAQPQWPAALSSCLPLLPGSCVTLGKCLYLSGTQVPTQESEGPWYGLRCIPVVVLVPRGRRKRVGSDPEGTMEAHAWQWQEG